MDATQLTDLSREAIVTAALLVAPVLGVAFVVGCVIGVLQSITQLHDHAISFVPKLLAVAAILLISLPWMLEHTIEYVQRTIRDIPARTTLDH